MYYYDFVQYPLSSADLMSDSDYTEVNKLYKKYKKDPSPHKKDGTTQTLFSLSGMALTGAATIWIMADIASAGLFTMVTLTAGICLLGASEVKNQGNNHYHWENEMGQTVSSSRKIAIALSGIEKRLKASFNSSASNEKEQNQLVKEMNFLSRLTIPQDDRSYQKLTKPLSV